MSRFSRKEEAPQGSRSEEERERARLEREARRRQRTAEIAAVPAPEPEPEPAAAAPAREPEPEPEPPPAVRRVESVPGEQPLGVRRVGGSGHMSAAGALGPGAIPPKPHKPARRRRRPIVRVLPVILLLAVGAFAYAVFQPFKGNGHGTVVVNVPKGATASDIGKLLADRGVVDSSFFFGIRARLSGKRSELRSGRITLRKDMSYGAALDALTTAPAVAKTVKLTIPEGRSRREVVPLVKQLGLTGSYLAATNRSPRALGLGAPRSAHTLEGYLFPATYQLKPRASAAALVKQQVAAFKDAFGKVSLGYAKRKHLTRYDILIIASMIEREAQLASDRPLIAAVIYNRLHRHMPLGIDATLRYQLHNWSKPLKVSELQRDSPYNTRTRQGLPPTPIGNPGLSSMQAAAHPARKPYLFYVVKPCGNGGHAFSSTEAKFQSDVAKYNAARAAKGGNNPKNC